MTRMSRAERNCTTWVVLERTTTQKRRGLSFFVNRPMA